MAVGKSHRPIFIGLSMAAVLSAASLSGKPADPVASPSLAPAFVPQRGGGGGAAPPQVTSNVPELKFRYVGPPSAGRVASVAGVPGDPTTYYLGAASGGVWKST